MKIMLCFGTRPEAIKMAPVIQELKKRELDHMVCVSAQHREMLDQVLDFFQIVPDYDLNLMRHDQSLNQFSSKLFLAMDEILEKERPDLVLVHGDTTTSVITALAAFHKCIKIGHIEAGLRTYDKSAPFPEEINRQMTARLADLHFAPTKKAADNLLTEKIPETLIEVTGNTVVDALIWGRKKIEREEFENQEVKDLQKKLDPYKDIILVTGHRRESFGEPQRRICHALAELASENEVQIVYPVHLNPQVLEPVRLLLEEMKNILLIPPVSYPTMLWLMLRSKLIISDSGGIQEEAPSLGKPLLITREVSERMEGVEFGGSILVGSDPEKIMSEVNKILNDNFSVVGSNNPFGDGQAARRIVDRILRTGK